MCERERERVLNAYHQNYHVLFSVIMSMDVGLELIHWILYVLCDSHSYFVFDPQTVKLRSVATLLVFPTSS